jgi:hypothetical protein
MPDEVELVHCPNCPDQGWYAVGSNEDAWEQVPCQFCYTVPNSYFNAFQHGVEPTVESVGSEPAIVNQPESESPA